MRPIDADKVLGVLRELAAHSFSGTIHIKNAMHLINEQPTVYDVDKVVEQLEEERELAYADFDKYAEEVDLCFDSECDDFFHTGLERAIKVLKAGGVINEQS